MRIRKQNKQKGRVRMMKKEKIIIDGVDISGCEYFRWFDSRCSSINCPYGGHPSCENIPNCQYKRLMGELNDKTAECEKYKKALGEIRRYCMMSLRVTTNRNSKKFLQILIDISKVKGGNDEKM